MIFFNYIGPALHVLPNMSHTTSIILHVSWHGLITLVREDSGFESRGRHVITGNRNLKHNRMRNLKHYFQ